MIKRICLLPFVLCLSLIGFAQTKEQIRPLAAGRPFERAIAGGETHTYQIQLTAGQFMRVLVEQKSIDVSLALTGPDGKQLLERDLNGVIGARELLTFEATTSGDYRLVVRANGAATVRGAYQVLVELKDAATAQDRKRLAAEQLLHEARRLHTDQKYADPQLSEKLGRSLALWRELNDRYWQGFALNLIGLTRFGAGQFDKAIEPFGQALALWREEKVRAGEALSLRNLGDTYSRITRLDKAVESYEQALPIYREIKDRQGEALVLGPLANVYSHLGRPEKAIEYFEQALPINREFKNRAREANNLNGLGNAKLKLGRYEQAIEFYEQALALSREYKLRGLEATMLGNIGGAYTQLGRYDKAIEYSQQALVINRETKNRGGEVYALLILGDGFHGQAQYPQAIQHHEQSLRLAREIMNRGQEGEALECLMLDWQVQNKPTLAIFFGKQAVNLLQEIRSEITTLERETQQSFVKSKERTYRVILTTPDFQKGYEYPIKAADLNRKVLEYREVLQNPKLDPLPLAQELYRILVGPAVKDLKAAKAQTLMWSLDGVLRYVPIAALHDGKQYLVEQYRNVVFTPASQARLKDVPARNWDALGLGVTKAHGEKIPALPGVAEEMRGIIREEAMSNADAAGQKSGVLPGVVKLDEQFTEEVMLSQLRKRPKVVHIASHFQFQPGNETNSALLLGDGNFLSLAQIKSLPNVFGGVDLLTLSACNTATGGAANGKEVEGFGVLAQRQGAKAVVASLWPVADRSTKLLMQEFYRARESQMGMSKIAALREAQLKLLRGEIAVDTTQSASRQITHEEAQPGEAKRQLFKLDPKAPFAHPYYWAPFIMIGNWK